MTEKDRGNRWQKAKQVGKELAPVVVGSLAGTAITALTVGHFRGDDPTLEPQSSEPQIIQAVVKYEINVLEIADRREYEESARRLEGIVIPSLNPTYVEEHPEVLELFSGIDSLPDRDLQTRILIDGFSNNSQTGRIGERFAGARFLLNNENAETLIGGEIYEVDDEYLRITAQLDEDMNLIPGEVDYQQESFKEEDLEDVLEGFFNIPEEERVVSQFNTYRGTSGVSIEVSEVISEDKEKYAKRIMLFTLDTNGIANKHVFIIEDRKPPTW